MWSSIVILVAAVTAEAGQLYASAPQDRGQYYKGRAGTYNYGYNTGDGVAKVEVKQKDGSVVGSYRYFDPNGKQIVRSYVADSKGFRILGNDLPISPDTPAAAIVGAPALTASVEGAAHQVVDASIAPTKRLNTVDIQNINTPPLLRHYYQQRTVFQQQNDLLAQQQRLIERQQQQLAALRSSTASVSVRQTVPTNFGSTVPTNFGSTVSNFVQSNTVEDDSPYYYFPYQYNYEFPAGFAFSGGLVQVPQPTQVVGVQSLPQDDSLAVGRSHTRVPKSRPIQVVSRNTVPSSAPYVIGRT